MKPHKLLFQGIHHFKSSVLMKRFVDMTRGKQGWSYCQYRHVSQCHRNSGVLQSQQKHGSSSTPSSQSFHEMVSPTLADHPENTLQYQNNNCSRNIKETKSSNVNMYLNTKETESPFCICNSRYGSLQIQEHKNKYPLSNHEPASSPPNNKMLCMPCSQFHSMTNLDQISTLKDKRLFKLGKGAQPHQNFSFTPKGILDAAPSRLQPYMRLIRFDKPIGTWLLYWPCTWSIAMAAEPGHLPDFWLLSLFGAGAFFMRGAGCIINDMWDKDIDKKVERTKLRPLASGELSFYQGLGCLAGMLSVSLGILLQLNWYSVIFGSCSMFLVIVYPLAKRFTYWPQALLGVTLNWGVLISWSALHGCVEWPVVPLYVACVLYTMIYDSIYSHQSYLPAALMEPLVIESRSTNKSAFPSNSLTFNYGALLGWAAVRGSLDLSVVLPLYVSGLVWTLSYDTIYAHQDKYDDMLIGVKSTALKFGDATKKWLAGFGCLMISNLTCAGMMCDQTWPYYTGVAITASHLAYQILTVDLNNADDCAAKFRANTWLGFIMFTGVVMGTLLKTKQEVKDESKDKIV